MPEGGQDTPRKIETQEAKPELTQEQIDSENRKILAVSIGLEEGALDSDWDRSQVSSGRLEQLVLTLKEFQNALGVARDLDETESESRWNTLEERARSFRNGIDNLKRSLKDRNADPEKSQAFKVEQTIDGLREWNTRVNRVLERQRIRDSKGGVEKQERGQSAIEKDLEAKKRALEVKDKRNREIVTRLVFSGDEGVETSDVFATETAEDIFGKIRFFRDKDNRRKAFEAIASAEVPRLEFDRSVEDHIKRLETVPGWKEDAKARKKRENEMIGDRDRLEGEMASWQRINADEKAKRTPWPDRFKKIVIKMALWAQKREKRLVERSDWWAKFHPEVVLRVDWNPRKKEAGPPIVHIIESQEDIRKREAAAEAAGESFNQRWEKEEERSGKRQERAYRIQKAGADARRVSWDRLREKGIRDEDIIDYRQHERERLDSQRKLTPAELAEQQKKQEQKARLMTAAGRVVGTLLGLKTPDSRGK